MTRTYRDITYQLRRSKRRKTASLYIERDGRVTLIAPDDLPEERIDQLLETKRSWIYRGLAEWESLNGTRVEREFVNGEGFLYLGATYRLRLVNGDQREPLLLKNGYFCLRKDCQRPEEAFRQFYRTKGLPRIKVRVAHYAAKLGVQPRSVRVMELKNRWASCSPAGNLSFHWRCLMTPRKILDYIVAHEVAHLVHPDHSRAFWDTLDRILPEYPERKAWLRQNGASLGL